MPPHPSNCSHETQWLRFWKVLQSVSRGSIVIPLFILLRVFAESRQFPGVGLSLRSVAGLEDALDESCGSDVEDELVPEFDDNPETTRGTKLSGLA